MFFKMGVLKIPNIHRKTLVLESLFNKILINLQVCNFIKKRLQRRCFHVNIAKFLKSKFEAFYGTSLEAASPSHF